MVVVTDPRRQTVAVHRPGQLVRILGMDDVLDGEDVVPGWRLRCASVLTDRGRVVLPAHGRRVAMADMLTVEPVLGILTAVI